MPAARVHAVATTETTSGPVAVPVSLMVRQTERKPIFPSVGATSAPSVITMPEPMPLPKLMAIATSASDAVRPVSGSSVVAPPRMTIDGMATLSRPKWSITQPDG